jgi:hypothetical protein
VRQLATGYRIFDDEWNSAKSMIVTCADATRNLILAGIRDSIRWDIERLNRIINDFDKRGYTYTPDEVIAEFQRISQEHTLFNFMQREIAQLQQRGKIRTSETYQTALNSYRNYRDGEDIMLDAITSDEMQLYEGSMTARGLCPNTTSFYMRILLKSKQQTVKLLIRVNLFQDRTVINNYTKEDSTLPTPQLSVGAWIAAALTTNALVEISLGKQVKECPKFYLASLMGDRN